MSDESSTEYALKFGSKLATKVALNTVAPGSGAIVDFAEAGKNFYDGDVADGVVNTLSGVADLVTLGMSSAAKDVMKESGKAAVVQTAKESAKTAGKKATKEVGEELAKQLAKGTITTSGKQAAIESVIFYQDIC